MRSKAISVALAFGSLAAFAVQPSDYSKKLTLTVNPAHYASGLAAVSNLPVPVRLSESISNFYYTDVTQTGSDKDLLFVDGEGTQLPYEIEKWNDQGESIVWVRVPTWTSSGHIYMYYGGPAVTQNSAAVWSDYVGVWHMAEDSGTVADATGNGLAASPAGDNTAQSVATTGPVGNGRVNATDNAHTYLSVANSDLLDCGNSLSFSGWVKVEELISGQLMSIVMRKESIWDGSGWNVNVLNNADHPYSFGYYGAGNADWGSLAALDVSGMLANWVHITVTYNGNAGYMYINGALYATVRQSDWTANTWVSAPADNDLPLVFGYTSNGHYEVGPHLTDAFQGSFDEFRLSDGVLDADRIKAEYVSQAYADALLYEVSEVVSGTVTLADAITHSIVSADGKNTLTVTANVTALNGDSAKVFLAVGMAEPKDGDPAALMKGVITNTVTATGNTVFTWDGAILGTKLAFAVMNVVESGGTASTNSTSTTVLVLQDTMGYRWVPNAKGLWSDAENWTLTKTDDGLPRLGYPSYGSTFTIYGSAQTSEIWVDANYEDLEAEDRGSTLGWENDEITFKGVVNGAAIGYPDNSGFKDGQYTNVKITLDNVSLTCGSYHVYGNSSLHMLNGARLYTRWEFLVENENAFLFVGDRCELEQYGIDGNRFEVSGENASVVISNGTVIAKSVRFGARYASADKVGKIPAGMRFEGDNPRLLIRSEATIPLDIGADFPVVFCIPENGYASAPIAKDSSNNVKFADRPSSVTHGLAFAVDMKSPYLAGSSRFRQQLVDWTYNGNSYEVNASAVSFAEMKYAPTACMYFTPESGETKSGVAAYCYTQKGTCIIIR